MIYALLATACFLVIFQAYRWWVMVGEVRERDRAIAAAKAAADAEPFPEPDEEDDVADEEDDIDICLRVGMPVVCILSETSHTHGTILGFTMGMEAGAMLAIVDVGAQHPMPISVDQVEPRGPARGPGPGYRDSADPNKQWN
jgi:hypothetical protein